MCGAKTEVGVNVPRAGEWWMQKGCGVLFIVGYDDKGNCVCKNKHGEVFTAGSGQWDPAYWNHEPACTGFNWVPEKWPKYYVGRQWSRRNTAYVIRTSEDQQHGVRKDGTVYRWPVWNAFEVNPYNMKEVTEEEASARLDPVPVPVDTADANRVYLNLYVDTDGPPCESEWAVMATRDSYVAHNSPKLQFDVLTGRFFIQNDGGAV